MDEARRSGEHRFVTALRRAFLAVVPPPPRALGQNLQRIAAECSRRDLRWARTGQRHLTLQFLGAVSDSRPLQNSLQILSYGARPSPSPSVVGERSPTRAARTVLWLGVREGSDELSTLAGLRSAFSRSTRAPHARVARQHRPICVGSIARARTRAVRASRGPSTRSSSSRAIGIGLHTEQARFRLAG